MWDHFRKTHQQSAVVKGVPFKRDTATHAFMCDCGSSYSMAKGLARHASKCPEFEQTQIKFFEQQRLSQLAAAAVSVDPTSLATTQPVAVLTATSDTAQQRLSSLGLKYYPSCKLLLCINQGCSQVLKNDIRGHVSKHGIALSAEESVDIQTLYMSGISSYFGNERPAVPPPPVPFLELLRGSACTSCGYCATRSKQMNVHLKGTGHSETRFCFVHKIERGRAWIYVEVLPNQSVQASFEVEEQARALIAAATSVPAEVQSQVSIYDQFLLCIGIKVNRDVSKCIKLRRYIDVEQWDALEPLLKKIFGSVRGASVHVRSLFPGRLMKEHQTPQTTSNYMQLASSFVKFALNAAADESKKVCPKVRRSAVAFMASMTVTNVGHLLYALVSEMALSNRPVIYEEFLRASLFNEERSYMGTVNVGPLCAKLLYLQKIAAIHMLSHTFGKARKRLVAKYKRTFNLCSLNGHSAVATIMNLARNIASTMISRYRVVPLSLEKGDIQVDGVNMSLVDMRTAYAKIAAKCAALQESLLLGAHLSFNVEDIDQNNSGRVIGQGIKCREMVRQEHYTHYLLRHILKNDAMRAKFIDSGVNDAIRFKASEVTSYLRQHEEFTTFFTALVHISSGCPARGTEIGRYTIANDPVQRRVVYDFGKRVAFVSS